MEEIQKHTYVLILAGGGGTRLWPMSREESPKQFLKIFSGQSLFEMTLDRALKITNVKHIFVSTATKYADYIQENFKKIPAENIISEPQRRDTALALGLAAAIVYKKDPEAVIVNLPCDHLITPVTNFVSDVTKAVKHAQENKFVTIGIKPKFAHTGMGHIKVSGQVGEKFVEKPDMQTAQKYTSSGDYLWNAGIYIWKAKLLLDLLKKYAPKTYAYLPKVAESLGTGRENEALKLAFQMSPTISIDYAVSEKMQNFVCLKASFNWSDIGDWSEVKDHLPHDALGNVILGNRGSGDYIGVDSKNNLLVLDKQLVTTVGIENLLVVDTPESLLICNITDDQAVKKIVEMLKEQKLTKYL